MDLTPQLLQDVEFREKFRGYDPDEVDEFLERIGAAVASLQGRLREATARAEAAEANAGSAPAPVATASESEETLRRTLVLAQRTADAAVAEANETASRTVAEANSRAAETLAAAEAESSRLRSEADATKQAVQQAAEAEARAFVEATRQPLLEEIATLEQAKTYLLDDIEILERHVGSHRDRVRATINDLSRLVEDPSSLRVAPTPELSGAAVPTAESIVDDVSIEAAASETIDLTEAPAEVAAAVDPVPTPEPAADVAAEVPDPAPTPIPEVDLDLTAEIDVTELDALTDAALTDAAVTEDPVSDTPVIDVSGDSAEVVHAASDVLTPDDEPEPVAVGTVELSDSLFGGADPQTGQPPTETGGDAFLEELRRAVSDVDEESASMSSFFDDDDGESRSRFGRRR